jgi:exodeoxyribonuclease-3
MKIVTWNINGIRARLGNFTHWLRESAPDIVCLQEIKSLDEQFPRAEIEALGYNVETHGQKGFNGVALLSKLPFDEVTRGLPGDPEDEQARFIEGVFSTDKGALRVASLYLPNGNPVDDERKFPYKLAWLSALRRWVEQECAAHPQLALLGDYNIAPEDRDVYDPVTWAGQVLCTPEERAHFKGLLALGLHDSFRLFEQPPKSWSWWDYRNLAFRKNQGLRIDHILVSEALKPHVQSCVIDKLTRKNERPSDHAPVLAEIGPIA